MGVELDEVETEFKDDEMNPGQIKQAFADGVDGAQMNAEDKLNHDEDDEDIRMTAVVYDSDDDKANDRRWGSRGKWVEKALTDFCENEKKNDVPKPWKKLHSKFVDEFVRKFCGFYSYESRPVAWKRVWHCYTTDFDAPDSWPGKFTICAFFSLFYVNLYMFYVVFVR